MAVNEASVRAYVGLGSNLDNPAEQLRRAFNALMELPRTRLHARSSLYRSSPLGPPGQPGYLNAVAELETGLEPEALLDALQGIEAAQGRVRTERWGPRTLDLDLLLYGERTIATPRLVVPHPQLPERNFVLYPLTEIAPGLDVPGLGNVRTLAQRLGSGGLERVDHPERLDNE